MYSQDMYRQAIKLLQRVMKSVCVSHDVGHAQIVFENAKKALSARLKDNQISEQKQTNILLAALLHDADDSKFTNHTHNQNAYSILTELQIPNQQAHTIVDIIELVSFSKNGDDIDPHLPIQYYYPRYADRLQAIGRTGIIRVFQYNSTIKNPISCTDTARPVSDKQLDEVIEGRDLIYKKSGGKSNSLIDHFYDKLLHVKCPQSMRHNSYFVTAFHEKQQIMRQFVLEESKTGFKYTKQRIESIMSNS